MSKTRFLGLFVAGLAVLALAAGLGLVWSRQQGDRPLLADIRILPVSDELAGAPRGPGPVRGEKPGTHDALGAAGRARAADAYILQVHEDEDAAPLADRIEVTELPPIPPEESGEDAAPAFSFETVVARARDLSASPYRELPDPPQSAADLDYNEYRRIRLLPGGVEWRDDPQSFYRVHYDPRGYLFPHRVAINLVEDGRATPHVYDPAQFDFDDLPIPEADRSTLGFAGFRITTPLNRPGTFDELLSFRGASFFRVLAAGAVYGASARGLAIGTASPSGEEFPVFREFWLQRPENPADPVTIYALMDSPSTTGAFRFTVRPGVSTVVDVEAVFLPRRRIELVGIAPITSMYYFSPHDIRREVQDFRPAVHDSEGLSIWLRNGEWAWRPLINPARLQISSFASQPPLGFGLTQRSREHADFEDLEADYHKRPSVWITPGEGWGAGQLTLVEIPTENEYNDNIVVFWRPETPWEAGRETRVSYRMNWGVGEPVVPVVAQVSGTRAGRAPGSGQPIFVIEFEGAGEQMFEGAEPRISASDGTILRPQLLPNPETGGVRMVFEFEPGDSTVAELRAYLDRNGEPVSETWLYRWRAQ